MTVRAAGHGPASHCPARPADLASISGNELFMSSSSRDIRVTSISDVIATRTALMTSRREPLVADVTTAGLKDATTDRDDIIQASV